MTNYPIPVSTVAHIPGLSLYDADNDTYHILVRDLSCACGGCIATSATTIRDLCVPVRLLCSVCLQRYAHILKQIGQSIVLLGDNPPDWHIVAAGYYLSNDRIIDRLGKTPTAIDVIRRFDLALVRESLRYAYIVKRINCYNPTGFHNIALPVLLCDQPAYTFD